MKKQLIRKEFFKLKINGHSYSQCKIILKARYNHEVIIRTLKRWMNRLDNEDNWDLNDKSRRQLKCQDHVKGEELVVDLILLILNLQE